MKWISKIETWFSKLAFKWQIFIAMATLFLVMVAIIAVAN